jgi:hypothetical protein
MRPHSAHFVPALKPASATSPMLAHFVGSFAKLAASFAEPPLYTHLLILAAIRLPISV